MIPPGEDSAWAAILAAARECFAEAGPATTRMGTVAARAGVSRQYLYRFVASKEQMVEEVLLVRLVELGEELRAAGTRAAGDVDEAVMSLVLTGVGSARNDAEFVQLADALPVQRLQWLLTSDESPVHAINAAAFGPVLERAGAAGRLRTDLPAGELVGWLQTVMASFAARTDLDEPAMRDKLRTFVLPVILTAS